MWVWSLYWLGAGIGAVAAIVWVLCRHIIPAIVIGTIEVIQALREAWPGIKQACREGWEGTAGKPGNDSRGGDSGAADLEDGGREADVDRDCSE